MPRSRSGIVRSWVIAWFVAMTLWLLLTATVDLQEVLEGLGASIIAATAFEIVRAEDPPRFRARLSWLRRLPWLPTAVLRDLGIVVDVLVRRLRGEPAAGRFVEVATPVFGDDPLASAYHLLATTAASTPPNCYLIGFDAERGTALLHQLRPTAPAVLDDVLPGN